MKKLLLFGFLLLIPTILTAEDYYDLQHHSIVPDTVNNRNDWYFRGSFNIVASTYIVKAASCPVVISFGDDGVIVGSISSATWADNTGLLDGYNYDYFASTTALQAEIDARISADSLLGSATNQIRIDFEAYDSLLNTSTSTLRTDLISEIATRISEDNLISDATGQIRIDFEAYDSELNASTTTLRTDLTTEINNRINGDSLLGSATGQLRLDLINEISSLATTYLGINAKADDSDLLDGYNYDYFLDTTTAASNYLGISAKAADSDLLDGYNYDHFLSTADAEVTYLGIGDIALNSYELEGFTYEHFVDTVTAQSIDGEKIFNDLLTSYELETDTITYRDSLDTIRSQIYFDESTGYLIIDSSLTVTGSTIFASTSTVDLISDQEIGGEKTFTDYTIFESSITVEGYNLVPEREDYIVGFSSDTYSGSLSVFDIPWEYVTDGKQLKVYNDGILMRPDDDYTETDNNTITFSVNRSSGSYITIMK